MLLQPLNAALYLNILFASDNLFDFEIFFTFLGYAVIQLPEFLLLAFRYIKKQQLRLNIVQVEEFKGSSEIKMKDSTTDLIMVKKVQHVEEERSRALTDVLHNIEIRLDGIDRELAGLKEASNVLFIKSKI